MALTVEEYHQRSRERFEKNDIPGSQEITPTSCVLSGSYLSTFPGMSDVFYVFDDLGGAVSFCRCYALPEEVSKGTVWASQHEVEHYFDALLERFVRDGYQPEIREELLEGIEQYFRIYRLDTIFVLPDDLDDLLDYTGNPFKHQWATYAEDDWGEDEEDQGYKAKFDLNNPDHCAALWDRLWEMIA